MNFLKSVETVKLAPLGDFNIYYKLLYVYYKKNKYQVCGPSLILFIIYGPMTWEGCWAQQRLDKRGTEQIGGKKGALFFKNILHMLSRGQ